MRRVLALALAAAWSSAAAQEVEPGAYVGLGVGSFDYETDVEDEIAALTFSDSATAIKAYGGYRFSDHFGLEASYQATDTVEESLSGPDLGDAVARVGADFDVAALRAVGHVPLSWGSFFVGAGYFDGDWDAFVEIDGAVPFRVEDTISEDGLNALLGLQWDMSAVSLRAEYEWWDIDDADAFQLGLTAHYRF